MPVLAGRPNCLLDQGVQKNLPGMSQNLQRKKTAAEKFS